MVLERAMSTNPPNPNISDTIFCEIGYDQQFGKESRTAPLNSKFMK